MAAGVADKLWDVGDLIGLLEVEEGGGRKSGLRRIKNGAYKDNGDSSALVVVGRRAFISHSVQPVVARNYLYCGIYSFDCFAEARFKVAHYPLASQAATETMMAIY
jgi:hypothetical protein